MMPNDKKQGLWNPGGWIQSLGKWFQTTSLWQILRMFFPSVWLFIRSLRPGNRINAPIANQIFFTGVQALPLVTLVALLFGTVVMLQAVTVMPKVGFGNFFGSLMVIVVIRELGPILTAFLVAGRTGSALATYIGNMKVESEVDVLESMGVDPKNHLVMPAVIGGMIAMVALNILFSSVAIVAGFLFARMAFVILDIHTPMEFGVLIGSIFHAMTVADLFFLIIKPLVFGIIITSLACSKGLALENDARKVPVAASSSVVQSYAMIVVANLVMSAFYLIQYYSNLQSLI